MLLTPCALPSRRPLRALLALAVMLCACASPGLGVQMGEEQQRPADATSASFASYNKQKEVVTIQGKSLRELLGPMFEYKFMLPEVQLRKGMSYVGSNHKMRRIVSDLITGKRPVKIRSDADADGGGDAAELAEENDKMKVELKKALKSANTYEAKYVATRAELNSLKAAGGEAAHRKAGKKPRSSHSSSIPHEDDAQANSEGHLETVYSQQDAHAEAEDGALTFTEADVDVADDEDAAESEPTDPPPHQHTPINTTPTLGALDFTEAGMDVADDEDAAESEPTDTHPHQHTPINTPPT
eukprot:gene15648-21755_t